MGDRLLTPGAVWITKLLSGEWTLPNLPPLVVVWCRCLSQVERPPAVQPKQACSGINTNFK